MSISRIFKDLDYTVLCQIIRLPNTLDCRSLNFSDRSFTVYDGNCNGCLFADEVNFNDLKNRA